jgi:hypothetical protein
VETIRESLYTPLGFTLSHRVLCASVPGLLMMPLMALHLLLCCYSLPAAETPWIKVNSAGTGFEKQDSGQIFDASGFNYDHDRNGRLIEDYWHTEWPTIAADFKEMRNLGARVVRIHLQFAANHGVRHNRPRKRTQSASKTS